MIISTGAQYVTSDSKIYCGKSKCASLAQEIGFSAPNLCSLPWLVNSTTQLCTSQHTAPGSMIMNSRSKPRNTSQIAVMMALFCAIGWMGLLPAVCKNVGSKPF
jgi:hypothetical protein